LLEEQKTFVMQLLEKLLPENQIKMQK